MSITYTKITIGISLLALISLKILWENKDEYFKGIDHKYSMLIDQN